MIKGSATQTLPAFLYRKVDVWRHTNSWVRISQSCRVLSLYIWFSILVAVVCGCLWLFVLLWCEFNSNISISTWALVYLVKLNQYAWTIRIWDDAQLNSFIWIHVWIKNFMIIKKTAQWGHWVSSNSWAFIDQIYSMNDTFFFCLNKRDSEIKLNKCPMSI